MRTRTPGDVPPVPTHPTNSNNKFMAPGGLGCGLGAGLSPWHAEPFRSSCSEPPGGQHGGGIVACRRMKDAQCNLDMLSVQDRDAEPESSSLLCTQHFPPVMEGDPPVDCVCRCVCLSWPILRSTAASALGTTHRVKAVSWGLARRPGGPEAPAGASVSTGCPRWAVLMSPLREHLGVSHM